MLADLVQEELQAVRDDAGGRRSRSLPPRRRRGSLDLHIGRRKRGPHLVEGVVVELVLQLQGLELGNRDHAALARILQEAGEGRIRIQGIGAQSNIRTHQKFLRKQVRVKEPRGFSVLIRANVNSEPELTPKWSIRQTLTRASQKPNLRTSETDGYAHLVLSPSVDNLVAQLTRLPGIGSRTAQRLAFHILRPTRRRRSRSRRRSRR